MTNKSRNSTGITNGMHTAFFELFLDRLIFNHDDKKEHKLYKFPAVKRDFDFVFKKGIKLKDVKQSIKNTSSLVIGNKDNTLANALVAHFGQESLSNVSSVRPGIVHRLDKETCGFLIIAKNDKVHAKLCQDFSQKLVTF